MNNLYPLSFHPIFKERIWGGTHLKKILNKEFDGELIGESWELSSLTNDVSVVKDGFYKDKDLNELINLFPKEILGESVISKYGTTFPLLIKFLDAQQDLSIQLHPNDELALKRHNSYGKTEMWYVVDAQENSRLIVGFKKDSNQEEYINHLNEKKLIDILEEIPVKKGDVFMLETGTIHAIGAGILIAEIQQTSDVTYRIYDFDRVDASGNGRELHTELALEAINYNVVNSKRNYTKNIDEINHAVSSKYFNTSVLFVENEINIYTNEKFIILMCTEGEIIVNHENLNYNCKKGDTMLIPACLGELKLIGKGTILHITI